MAQYVVEMQEEKHEKFYFIRETESMDIVLLPSKYLMHKKRSHLSPKALSEKALARSYYRNYMVEGNLQIEDIYGMAYAKQHEHFTDFLLWLKTGSQHIRKEYKKLPSNETCNSYLKGACQSYSFLEHEYAHEHRVTVL